MQGYTLCLCVCLYVVGKLPCKTTQCVCVCLYVVGILPCKAMQSVFANSSTHGEHSVVFCINLAANS